MTSVGQVYWTHSDNVLFLEIDFEGNYNEVAFMDSDELLKAFY